MSRPFDFARVPEESHVVHETSVWPFWFAMALSLFVVFLTWSAWLGLLGLVTVLFATSGWMLHNTEKYAVTGPQSLGAGPIYKHSRVWWASVAVIISEVALFVAVFVVLGAYGVTREPISEPIRGLNEPTVLVASVVLWSSGFTGMMAGRRLEASRRPSFLRWLGATIVLGTVFLGYQGYEYNNLVHEGFGLRASRDAAVFYGLTGLHGFHLFGGLVALVALFFFGRHGSNLGPGPRGEIFRAVMLYWHFVDIAWVFIYGTLYLHLV